MTSADTPSNRVRERRLSLGLTQAALAQSAGVSRTAITAIEGSRLVPSVAAALAIAQSLSCSVEELFGNSPTNSRTPSWAWPQQDETPSWHAEVLGRIVQYPCSTAAMHSILPDQLSDGTPTEFATKPGETLVMASCDPAAGILARQFERTTGLRLIVLPRSSRQALEMLRDGVVHLAGLHLATEDEPDRNAAIAKAALGSGYQMLRMASWQEGIVVAPSTRIRSVRTAIKAKLGWVGRETGSGARSCMDRLFDDRKRIRHIASDHWGVAEAVRSGWADAGVCVELVGREAGLSFLPVQSEPYDLVFPARIGDDRRIKSLLTMIRSTSFTRMMEQSAGYDMHESGTLWDI